MEYLYINTYVANNTLVVKSIRADEVKSYIQTVISNHRHKYTNHITEKDIVGVVNVTRFRMVRQSGKVWDQLVSSDTIWLVTVKEWDYYTREVLRPKDASYRLGKLIVERYPGALSASKLKDFINYFFPGGQLLAVVLPSYSTSGPRSPVPDGIKSPKYLPVEAALVHTSPVPTKRPDAMTVSAAKKLHLLDASKNRRHPLEYPHLHLSASRSVSDAAEAHSEVDDDLLPRETLRFDHDGLVDQQQQPHYHPHSVHYNSGVDSGASLTFSQQHASRVEAITQHLEQHQLLAHSTTSATASPHAAIGSLSMLELGGNSGSGSGSGSGSNGEELSPQQALRKRMALDTASFTSPALLPPKREDTKLGTPSPPSPPPPPPSAPVAAAAAAAVAVAPVVVAVDLAALTQALSPAKLVKANEQQEEADSPTTADGGASGSRSATSSSSRRRARKKRLQQRSQKESSSSSAAQNDNGHIKSEQQPLQLDTGEEELERVQLVRIPTGDFPLSPSAMIAEENAHNLDSLISEVKTLKTLLSAKGKDRNSILSLLAGQPTAREEEGSAAVTAAAADIASVTENQPLSVSENNQLVDIKSVSELPVIDRPEHYIDLEEETESLPSPEPGETAAAAAADVVESEDQSEDIINDKAAVDDTNIMMQSHPRENAEEQEVEPESLMSDISRLSEEAAPEWVPFTTAADSPVKVMHHLSSGEGGVGDRTGSLPSTPETGMRSAAVGTTPASAGSTAATDKSAEEKIVVEFVPFDVQVDGDDSEDSLVEEEYSMQGDEKQLQQQEEEDDEESVTVYSEVDGPTPQNGSFVSEEEEMFVRNQIIELSLSGGHHLTPAKAGADDDDDVSELAEEDPVDLFPNSREEEEDADEESDVAVEDSADGVSDEPVATTKKGDDEEEEQQYEDDFDDETDVVNPVQQVHQVILNTASDASEDLESEESSDGSVAAEDESEIEVKADEVVEGEEEVDEDEGQESGAYASPSSSDSDETNSGAEKESSPLPSHRFARQSRSRSSSDTDASTESPAPEDSSDDSDVEVKPEVDESQSSDDENDSSFHPVDANNEPLEVSSVHFGDSDFEADEPKPRTPNRTATSASTASTAAAVETAASSTASEDAALREQLAQQAAALEEVSREKAALEARLQETRYLLQVFAGMQAGTAGGGASAEAVAAALGKILPTTQQAQTTAAGAEVAVRDVSIEELEAAVAGVSPRSILKSPSSSEKINQLHRNLVETQSRRQTTQESSASTAAAAAAVVDSDASGEDDAINQPRLQLQPRPAGVVAVSRRKSAPYSAYAIKKEIAGGRRASLSASAAADSSVESSPGRAPAAAASPSSKEDILALSLDVPHSPAVHHSAESSSPLSPFPPLPPPVSPTALTAATATEEEPESIPLVGGNLASDSISEELHYSQGRGIIVPAATSATAAAAVPVTSGGPVVPNKATVLVNKIHKKIRRHTVAVAADSSHSVDPPTLSATAGGPASIESATTFSPVYSPTQGQTNTNTNSGPSPVVPDRVRADSDISFASIASKDVGYIRPANRRQGRLIARSMEKKIIDEVAREMNAMHDVEALKATTHSEEGEMDERTSPLVVSVRKPLHQSSLLQPPQQLLQQGNTSSPRTSSQEEPGQAAAAAAMSHPPLTAAAVAALMPEKLSVMMLPQEDEYVSASSNRKFTVDELSVSSSNATPSATASVTAAAVLKSPKVIQITESLYEPAGAVVLRNAEPEDEEEEISLPPAATASSAAESPVPALETDRSESLPSMASSDVVAVVSPPVEEAVAPSRSVPASNGTSELGIALPRPDVTVAVKDAQTTEKRPAFTHWEPPHISTSFETVSPPPSDDPLHSLLQYHRPFLITEKYLENPAMKGHQARYQIINCISERELLFFVLFQLFGTVDGVLVKNIKMTQVSRLLKDLELISILASQLDTLLVKSLTLPSRSGSAALKAHLNSAKSTTSASTAQTNSNSHADRDKKVMMKTGTYSKVQNKAVEHGAASHLPTFQMFFNLMHCVALQLTPPVKGKQPPVFGSQEYESLVEKHMKTIEGKVRSWLLKSHAHQYDLLYAESKHSLSGILLRTMYRKFAHPTFQHHHGPSVSAPDTMHHQPSQSANSSVTMSPNNDHRGGGGGGSVVSGLGGGVTSPLDGGEEHDAEMTRHVWERNTEQIRQIFNFYASTLEVRRLGHGVNKLYMSIENCKEMLIDFQVIPGIINAQDFTRLFRACKLWEWHIAECLLASEQALGSAVKSPLTADDLSITKEDLVHSQQATPHTPHSVHSPAVDALGNVLNFEDPYDFKGTIGNLSLSLIGFMELLTRIAFNHHKLGNHTYESLENLMHLMDASNGKSKIIGTLRKSVSIRHFVYASGSASAHHHQHHQK